MIINFIGNLLMKQVAESGVFAFTAERKCKAVKNIFIDNSNPLSWFQYVALNHHHTHHLGNFN